MKREEKAALVERLRADLAAMPNIMLAEYRGLTVEQMTELRTRVRKAAGAVRVVKNTFLRRAVAGTANAGVTDLLQGPNVLVLGRRDPLEVLKAVTAADKELEKFKLKGGVIDGCAMTPEQLRQVAALPPRAELLGRAVGSIASPLRGFVGVCQGNIRKLVYALEAVRQAKAGKAA